MIDSRYTYTNPMVHIGDIKLLDQPSISGLDTGIYTTTTRHTSITVIDHEKTLGSAVTGFHQLRRVVVSFECLEIWQTLATSLV